MRLEIEQNVASVPFSNEVQSGSDPSASGIDIGRLLKQGVSAAQSGERGLARTLLFRVTESDPRNADAWLWLASISEYPEELLGFLDNVLDIDPDNFRARQWKTATRSLLAKTFVQRGASANEEGQPDFALNCFDKAIEYDERCESAWLWKASLAVSEQDRVQFLEHVLELNPDNDEALAAVHEIVKDRTVTKMNNARSAAVNGDFVEAEKLLDEILANNPDSMDAWILKSQVAQPFEEKLLAYRRVFELDPSNMFAHGGYEFLADLFDESNDVSDPAPETQQIHSDPFEKSSNEIFLVADPALAEAEFNNISDESLESEELIASDFSADVENSHANTEVDNDDSDIAVQALETSNPSDVEAASEPDTWADGLPETNMTMESEFDDSDFRSQSTAEESSDFETTFEATEDIIEEAWQAKEPEVEVQDQEVDFSSNGFKQEERPWYYAPAVQEELPSTEDVHFDEAEDGDQFSYENDAPVAASSDTLAEEQFDASAYSCPFCGAENESHSFECAACCAVLSLSDIDSLLANSKADSYVINQSVTRMEAEWNIREFNEQELTVLGIGQLNLKNNDRGLAYLQEAARINPNNVILAGQVNAIAIRLEETRRQNEIFDAMPKGKSILVVDDSATVRKLISSKLEKSGHNVVSAVDGVEAMEMIETMTPDLVLLDIAMPRMDGYSVCKLIRSNDKTKDVPVVMISGKDGFFDKVRGRMAGTTGYITKPFGPETLMRALETYLIPDQVSAD